MNRPPDAGAAGAGPAEVRAAEVHLLLAVRGQTVAVAESLTGGLLAAALVSVPGASATFRGGLVVYATDLKASLAGVSATLLAVRGPVDPDVAQELATGARRRCGADWGLSTTGVAGPDPQDGHPVGLVHVALSWADGTGGPAGPATADGADRTEVRTLRLGGARAEVRVAAAEAALALLAERLKTLPTGTAAS